LKINTDMLKEGVRPFGVTLSQEQLEKFERFYQLLIEWNQTMNLTAITNPDEAVSKHFVDSLAFFAQAGNIDRFNHIDIGSGGGLPGIAINIVAPNSELVLVESIGKKARYLENLVAQLELPNAKVLNIRAEDIPVLYPEYVNHFTHVTARAVGRLLMLLELAKPVTKKGGIVTLWKGRDQIAGLPKLLPQIGDLGFRFLNTHPYRIPMWNIDRFLITLKRL